MQEHTHTHRYMETHTHTHTNHTKAVIRCQSVAALPCRFQYMKGGWEIQEVTSGLFPGGNMTIAHRTFVKMGSRKMYRLLFKYSAKVKVKVFAKVRLIIVHSKMTFSFGQMCSFVCFKC